MACVTEASMSGLGSTLVEAHLEVQLCIMSAKLFFSKRTFVLVSHLRTKLRASPFRMLLSLKNNVVVV